MNMTDCDPRNFSVPDLHYLSFVSNGKTLNTTFWLTGSPNYENHLDSGFINETQIHQIFFSIVSNSAGQSLSRSIADWNEVIRSSITNFTLKSENDTRLGNTTLHQWNFVGIENYSGSLFGKDTKVEEWDIIVSKDGVQYLLSYIAEPWLFTEDLPIIKRIINSFSVNGTALSNTKSTQSGFTLYKNNDTPNKFSILYPSNWGVYEVNDKQFPAVQFFSPTPNQPYLVSDTMFIYKLLHLTMILYHMVLTLLAISI